MWENVLFLFFVIHVQLQVPWPTDFLDFVVPINLVNLDFLSVFMAGSCSLSVPFLDQFVLHMLLPVLLLFCVFLAFKCSRLFLRSKKQKLVRMDELKYQIIVLGALVLYPGLATKIFSVFRCKSINGIDGEVLVADFSIICYEKTHMGFSIVAAGCLFLYIITIPVVMLLVLWRNRKHLHVKQGQEVTKKHLAVKAKYGGLYLQYEPKYWVSGGGGRGVLFNVICCVSHLVCYL